MKWLSRHKAVGRRASELRRREADAAAPIDNPQRHDVAGEQPRQPVLQRATSDGKRPAGPERKWERLAHNRITLKPAIVRSPKMLKVESVCPRHIPRAIEHRAERPAANKLFWLTSWKKRQRKKRSAAVEYKNQPASLFRRITRLPRKRRYMRLCWNARAATIGAVSPIVKRAADFVVNDLARAKVGS
jgi:hypothetical protein